MRLFVYPYKQTSASAKLLATNLGAKLIKLQNSKYQPKEADVIIKWGSSSIPDFPVAKIFNKKPIGNKLEFFEWCHTYGIDDSVPKWTTNKDQAAVWIEEDHTVVARTLLNSHSGKGIVLCDKTTPLVDAPLYTQYVKKAHEYRVYYVKGHNEVMVKQKLKKTGENPSKIQNLDNGYVYGSVNHELSPVVFETAMKVAEAFNMDFGAIDIIWNKHYNRAYVLEINSAPGMVDSTCEFFTTAFKSILA